MLIKTQSSFEITCGSTETYDLSQLEAGQTYAATFKTVPSEGQTCTAKIYDKAGNASSVSVYNPGPDDCNRGGGGGDHPDDNHSAASPLGKWQFSLWLF